MSITLKAARVNKGLTQKQAAEKLNVSEDMVHNWETGKSFPNVLHIKDIEKVYEVTYDQLIFLPKGTV